MKVEKDRVYQVKQYAKDQYRLRDYITSLGRWSGEEAAQGNSVKICCPFHPKERTPSCFIDEDRGLWHCFSCGRGGDYVSFYFQFNKEVMGSSAGYYQVVNNLLAADDMMKLKLGFTSVYSMEAAEVKADFTLRRFIAPEKNNLMSYPELADRMLQEGINDIASIKLAILHAQDGIPPDLVYRYVTEAKEMADDPREVAFSQLNLEDYLWGDDDGYS